MLALPYFYFVDRRMRTPHDGYWLLGHWACSILKRGKHTPLNRAERQLLGQHWLSWLIKGFFLPLMFIYFCNYLQNFNNSSATTPLQFWFELLCNLAFLIDVGLVSMGYLLTLRLADTHVRSAERCVHLNQLNWPGGPLSNRPTERLSQLEQSDSGARIVATNGSAGTGCDRLLIRGCG